MVDRAELTKPTSKAKVLSSKTILMANVANAASSRQETVEEIPEDLTAESGGSGTITHRSPQKFVVFKPYQPYGYRRVELPSTQVGPALANGFLAECPDCGDANCGGYLFCTAREPLARRRCPICQRSVPDEIIGAPQDERELEPGEIRDEAYKVATAAERTKVRLDMHILTFHPQQAPNYGLQNPALREPAAVPMTPNWPAMVPDNPAPKVGA